jgi:polyhydroxybutyrate depolymerase
MSGTLTRSRRTTVRATAATIALVAVTVVAIIAVHGTRTTGTGSTGSTGSAGCGTAPSPGPTGDANDATGDVPQHITVGVTTRDYRLAVPADYRPSVPTPLILLFHGSGSNAEQMSVYTQMPVRAGRSGYLVATPDAVAGQWRLSKPGAKTADLALVTAMIANLSSRYCVDSHRIYAAGISLGSEFAAISACTFPRTIAAIGLASAEYLLRPCTRTVPVIAFHGTADPLVAYPAGGVGSSLPGVHVPGVERNLADWSALDGCRPNPQATAVSAQVVKRTWGHCARGASVILYTVIGGAHTWPGSPITISRQLFGPTTDQIDATALMLDFFHRHRLS